MANSVCNFGSGCVEREDIDPEWTIDFGGRLSVDEHP
jgi:hypothetical protein